MKSKLSQTFDAPELVRINADRFEQSPFYPCYANDDTVLGVAAGRFYPSRLGDDPIETYWALRRRAVLFDVPEKPWQIEGPDATAFLEKLLSRRIGDLPVGRGRYAIACTDSGGIYMDGLVFKLSPHC